MLKSCLYFTMYSKKKIGTLLNILMICLRLKMSEEIKLEDSERQPCEVFSRVMGYFRPVYDWNIGKKQEFRDRIMYNAEPIQEQ